MKTIVAISTPIGYGGISIVRMSGPKSFSIAKKMITKMKNQDSVFENRKMYLCKINAGAICDIGLVVFFQHPDSYTGEDMVEFQVHGGVHLTNGIVKHCMLLGADLAQPGEFSKRAFINGKMSLESCEGVIDLINSESDLQIQTAYNLASGSFFSLINKYQGELTTVLAKINVDLDYPDEDIEVNKLKATLLEVKKLCDELQSITATFDEGKIIKFGINCAIIGLPNAGKSSLLNALLNEDRAIVSSIAGTTRDTIKESILFNGLKINLIDTAGINDAKNEIERIGVSKAIKEANEADVILFLFDGAKKFGKENLQILDKLNNKNIVLIRNKIDKSINENNEIFTKYPLIEISATKSQNLNKIKEKIYSLYSKINIKNSSIIITNERHFHALQKCVQNLKECLSIKNPENSLDIISTLIQNGYNHLGEITGEFGSSRIIDEIFSKFCLGK